MEQATHPEESEEGEQEVGLSIEDLGLEFSGRVLV